MNNRSEESDLRKALQLLNINPKEWNTRTPAERKKTYHKIFLKAILENHPDKHPECAIGDAQYTHYENITKTLNAINYDQNINAVSSHNPRSAEPESSESQSSALAAHRPYQPARYKPTSEIKPDETFRSMSGILMDYPRTSRDLTSHFHYTPGCNEYYEAFKEFIPNLVPWEESRPLQDVCNTTDAMFVNDCIATKLYLGNYHGADHFVSALVSQNHQRIKETFDQMVSSIKNTNWMLCLYHSMESRLNLFIGKFCEFKANDNGIFTGISLPTVLLLCRSLSLSLPYNIIDLRFDLDQELVRTALKTYVNGSKPTLQLNNKPHLLQITN